MFITAASWDMDVNGNLLSTLIVQELQLNSLPGSHKDSKADGAGPGPNT